MDLGKKVDLDKNFESLELKLNEILFSQDSISSSFRGGKSIQETINLLNRLKNEDVDGSYTKLKSCIQNKIPPIHVLKLPDLHPLREQGKYVSLDNRTFFFIFLEKFNFCSNFILYLFYKAKLTIFSF